MPLTAYFDCFAGASGDMILAALIDAGAPLAELSAELDKLRLPAYGLSADRVVKQGFAATKFEVRSAETGRPIDHTEDHGHADHHLAHDHKGVEDHPSHDRQRAEHEHTHGGTRHGHHHHGPHRHLGQIRAIIESADLAGPVKTRAVAIFTRLAEAEAAAHGVPVDKMHFHEVGAIDAIVDVVGACVAIDLLGIERVIVSPLPPGSGVVRCAHGTMPVPTPATLKLLEGVPLSANRNPGELLTPTGAAILTTLAERFADALPAGLRIARTGIGAGSREGVNVPNLLRVVLCEAPGPDGGPGPARLTDRPGLAGLAERDTVLLLETNLDDIDGVAIGDCLGRLLTAGALDVWATPIVMKKNRPAYMLSVLVEPGGPAEAVCRDLLFTHTSTFGVREAALSRSKLTREHVTVTTPYGPIRVKVGRLGQTIVQRQPEYEDCREAADRTGQPLADIRRAALAALAALAVAATIKP